MLAFLHTAHVHVETFGRLARQFDDSVPVRHEVRTELLATALALDSAASSHVTRTAVGEALRQLASEGARVVLCTCSTIAGLAEATVVPGCTVLRVDRPMVEEAVSSGRRILLVAALPTALQQTSALLRQVASAEHRSPEVVELLCGHAWRLFESGDTSGYLAEVAAAVGGAAVPGDLVLLAQASMAQVPPLIARPDLLILSSPKLAVAAAFAAYRAGPAAFPR